MATCNIAHGTRCSSFADAEQCKDFWCKWAEQLQREREYEAVCEAGRQMTLEQRHEGFVKAMREVDTPTLKRWASNDKLTQRRRDVAAQVLRERGL
jgi:hypothetical protein